MSDFKNIKIAASNIIAIVDSFEFNDYTKKELIEIDLIKILEFSVC